ncbi:MAG: cupredoxin domain-containing protein [Candidatus Bathyarchaeota archaeon]|nr:cupredoxin domain-containing protein [Candidatus Bathyarchaeota archaeon]
MVNQRIIAVAMLVVVVIAAAAAYLVFQGPAPEVPSTGDVKQFTLTARQWEFDQAQLEVNAVDTVVLNVTGLDDGSGAGHGFAIPEFNVDHVIRAGETRTIQFIATRPGTFTFLCSVQCGSGHNDMRGTIVVN